MSAITNINIRLNNNEEAVKAVEILRDVAESVTPISPNEIKNLLSDVIVDGRSVVVTDNYSLYSWTFNELIPQIIDEFIRCNFRAITFDAWFVSCNC
ncbi:MAG: hypothetical protein J5973_05895, partial [Eubacterium sp.]|nr:hypothetical protein [Eubacterium sp.]